MRLFFDRILTKTKNEKWKVLLFFGVMAIMLLYMRSIGTMIHISGDAMDIWKTITSFGTEDVYGSYVLYKGFFVLFPYVHLYNLSLFFGINEFFFIMLYHASLFAYLSTIGLPTIARYFFRKDPAIWQRALLAGIFFFVWRGTFALSQLMVDLPRFAYLVFSVNGVLRLTRDGVAPRRLYYLRAGLATGLCFCLAGTNSAAGICLILFAVVVTLPARVLKTSAKRWAALLCMAIFLLGCIVLPTVDTIFEDTFVTPLRDKYWILSKDGLLPLSLSALFTYYGHIPDMFSPRGYSLLMQQYGAEVTKLFMQGNTPMSILAYFKMAATYPIDMLTIWVNRFFLLLSASYGERYVPYLLLSYTLLFLAMLTVVKKVTSWKLVLHRNFLIFLAFLLTQAASVVGITEMRMGIPIQGFYMAIAVCSDTLWNGLRAFFGRIRQLWQEKSLRSLASMPFPWTFCLWAVFVVVCFCHLGLLLELTAEMTNIQPNHILFRIR